jgi:serine protease Do
MTMKKNIWAIAGLAAAALVLAALPGRAGKAQQADDDPAAKVSQGTDSEPATTQVRQQVQRLRITPGQRVVELDEGPSWLGVEAHEVTADNVKELKLPAERGVVVGRIAPNSPAAKAGLKENDVITEVDGQRVEGSTQFRRMIHEIPAGRTVQLSVWRDGRSQKLSATLGEAEQTHRAWMNTEPGSFSFTMPEVEVPDMPEVAPLESLDMIDGLAVLPGGRPRLGIDAEDISGQLGSYFGAPDGEGILVRNVNAGSAAEKAGLKAGDVITSFNGERIRSLGDLRERLSAKSDDKPVTLGIWRNKSSITLTVELPATKAKPLHRFSRSTHI